MSRPIKKHSHESATGVGPGSVHKTKGHHNLTLYVIARNFDPSADTVTITLEGSPTAQHFATLHYRAPNQNDVYEITASDFTQSSDDSSVYVACVSSNSFSMDNVRANITDHSGGFEIDTIILGSGYTGKGHRFETEGAG